MNIHRTSGILYLQIVHGTVLKFCQIYSCALPNFCPEESATPFVKAVLAFWGGGRRWVWKEDFAFVATMCTVYMYINVWDTAIHKELDCQLEPSNAHERPLCSGSCEKWCGCWPFAISHMYMYSCMYLLCIQGGVRKCHVQVAGRRKHSSDIHEDLEMPFILTFEAKHKELHVQKLKKILEFK